MSSGTAGKRYLAGDRPFTCLATFCFGCSPTSCRRIISAIARSSPEEAGQRAADLGRRTAELRPGTVLGREWNGRMHRVAVLAEGFAWNGKTYASLSKVALAITGTRWTVRSSSACATEPTMVVEPKPAQAGITLILNDL